MDSQLSVHPDAEGNPGQAHQQEPEPEHATRGSDEQQQSQPSLPAP